MLREQGKTVLWRCRPGVRLMKLTVERSIMKACYITLCMQLLAYGNLYYTSEMK